MLPALMLAGLTLAPPSTMPYFGAPSGSRYAEVRPGGLTILPNGRFLTPVGKRLYTNTDLWQVLRSPDGLVTVGVDDSGLAVYEGADPVPTSRRFVKLPGVAPCGVFTPDSRRLIVSLGDAGAIAVIDATSWEVTERILIDDLKDGYINDLALLPDGKTVVGLDIANQSVVTFELGKKGVQKRVAAGREPYALALSPDASTLYVANIGLFDYSLVGPAVNGKPATVTHPAFPFPSRESEVGVEQAGRKIPGIGKPGSADAQSVWKFDLRGGTPKVVAKAVSGILIHRPADGGKAVGGSAPNELLLHNGELFVANANNDTISVFDAARLRLKRTIKIAPIPALARYRGVIPSGMAMSPDGSRLYVCESGLNSVVALNPRTGEVGGRIPTGWFPMQIAVDAQGNLAVATQKGLGRGPLGRLHPRPQSDERFGLPDMPGMIQWVPAPSNETLKDGQRAVLRNNGMLPQPVPKTPSAFAYLPGFPSDKIKHVVFITKENHTFDGIFGGLKGARTEADYAEFGENGWIREKGREQRHAIMPNHLKLAREFSVSDNFYMEPQASGDGHRWLVGVYPSLWTSRVFYAGWNFRPNDRAKGRLASFESNGSQIPEDYLENGSLWEHLHRGGITFRNYGEGYELPGTDEPEPTTSRTGTDYLVNHPMPKVLWDNTDFNFPAYNNAIPDIARADWFIEDLENNFRKKGKPLPRFLNIAICNDHGSSPRKDWGYPYVSSFMADNDLALGRIVEYLSKQPEWKSMAIFVTQDDSGGDSDSVDRHRSFVLAISPYAKRGHVTHVHSSIISIIKSIYLIFGLGPNNQFDALANGLQDMFQPVPDFTPYKHVLPSREVFKAEDTFDPTDPKFMRRRKENPTKMDDPEFVEKLRKGGG